MTTLEPIKRRALRVLRMVDVLHGRGYQRMRIVPGMAASGMHWRCAVTSKQRIAPNHGAMLARGEEFSAPYGAAYTTGMDNEYWEWTDAKSATSEDLADLFLQRFPEICRESKGQDWEYAGWYSHMLGLAHDGAFPIAYEDSYSPAPVAWLRTSVPDVFVHMPPPGGAPRSCALEVDEGWGPWPVPRHGLRITLDAAATAAQLVRSVVEQARAAGLTREQLDAFRQEVHRTDDLEGVARVIGCWFAVQTTT